MTKYTAQEVREMVKEISADYGGMLARLMLIAYADLLEQMERAVPVAAPSKQCTARYAEVPKEEQQGPPYNAPVWCCLPAGHKGPHKCNHGGGYAPFVMRPEQTVEANTTATITTPHENDNPELLSIAEQWVALDGGSWNVERHASEKAALLSVTRSAIAKAYKKQESQP
jgi:hypothetical protein